jgi:hypothetical protein
LAAEAIQAAQSAELAVETAVFTRSRIFSAPRGKKPRVAELRQPVSKRDESQAAGRNGASHGISQQVASKYSAVAPRPCRGSYRQPWIGA